MLQHLQSEFDAILASVLSKGQLAREYSKSGLTHRKTPDRYTPNEDILSSKRQSLEYV